MIPYVLFLIVVPIAIISRVDIEFRASGKYLLGSVKLFAIAFLIALVCLGVEYNAILRAGNVSNKYIVYSLVPVNVISSSLNATSKAFKPYFKRTNRRSM